MRFLSNGVQEVCFVSVLSMAPTQVDKVLQHLAQQVTLMMMMIQWFDEDRHQQQWLNYEGVTLMANRL